MKTSRNLFVIGATGRTGRELVDMALARGHHVTAFVRSPDKLTLRHGSLRIVQGDPMDAEQVAAALPGHDTVFSALGPTMGEAMHTTRVLENSSDATLLAMKSTGVKRFLVVSSALLFPGGGPIPAFFRLLIRHHLHDARAMEATVRASALDWTIARPPRLVLEPDDLYRVADGAMPEGVPFFRAALSWRALARFLLDALDEARFVQKTMGVSR